MIFGNVFVRPINRFSPAIRQESPQASPNMDILKNFRTTRFLVFCYFANKQMTTDEQLQKQNLLVGGKVQYER